MSDRFATSTWIERAAIETASACRPCQATVPRFGLTYTIETCIAAGPYLCPSPRFSQTAPITEKTCR